MPLLHLTSVLTSTHTYSGGWQRPYVDYRKPRNEEILDPLIDEYEGVMDRLAFELHREGAISSQYEGLDFSERVTKVYEPSGKVHAKS